MATQDPLEIYDLFARFIASVYPLPRGLPGPYNSQSNVSLSSCFVECMEVEKKPLIRIKAQVLTQYHLR